jgi:hypothetical protein
MGGGHDMYGGGHNGGVKGFVSNLVHGGRGHGGGPGYEHGYGHAHGHGGHGYPPPAAGGAYYPPPHGAYPPAAYPAPHSSHYGTSWCIYHQRVLDL